MSQTPVVTPKPKYNKKSPWRWVDSQLENFMNEQKEMRKYISNIEDELSHTTQELDGIYQLVDTTPNNMELGKMVRTYYFENTEEVDEPEDEPVYIYESPDEGKTLYRREMGETVREKVEEPPISRERAQARLEYLKVELAHEQYHDGWTLKGMREEAEWLESQLSGEQLELFDDK